MFFVRFRSRGTAVRTDKPAVPEMSFSVDGLAACGAEIEVGFGVKPECVGRSMSECGNNHCRFITATRTTIEYRTILRTVCLDDVCFQPGVFVSFCHAANRAYVAREIVGKSLGKSAADRTDVPVRLGIKQWRGGIIVTCGGDGNG